MRFVDGPEVREGRPRSGKCGVVSEGSSGPSSSAKHRMVSLPEGPRSGNGRSKTVATVTLVRMSRVALLGGGKMGAALVGGLLDGDWDADALSIAEIDGERRSRSNNGSRRSGWCRARRGRWPTPTSSSSR